MTAQIRPWLETAGQFTVEHIPCPHFVQPVNLAGPRTGVIHTVEGSFDAGMGVFKQHFAPHFLVGPGRIAQLVQVGVIGAALVHHNADAIVQIEVAGKSETTPWMFDDATAEALAALMAVCQREYGIPLTHPWPDGDFGLAGYNPHRSAGKWGVVSGWFGHGDVPMPDTHWDPGALKWSELFARANAMTDILHAPGWVAPVAPPRPCAACAAPAPVAATSPPDGGEADAWNKWAQTFLMQHGATLDGGADGDFGRSSRNALAAYLVKHG